MVVRLDWIRWARICCLIIYSSVWYTIKTCFVTSVVGLVTDVQFMLILIIYADYSCCIFIWFLTVRHSVNQSDRQQDIKIHHSIVIYHWLSTCMNTIKINACLQTEHFLCLILLTQAYRMLSPIALNIHELEPNLSLSRHWLYQVHHLLTNYSIY